MSKRGVDLYEIWARAFNSWRPPRQPAVYLAPRAALGKSSSSAPPPPLGLISPDLKALEITAWNPLGQPADFETNRERNRQLQSDLDARRDRICMYWPSSGFDLGGWREDGFVIWLDADLDDEWVVELARQYDQGAIYRYRFEKDGDRMHIWRQTVPVVMNNDVGDDQVEMELIREPPSPPLG